MICDPLLKQAVSSLSKEDRQILNDIKKSKKITGYVPKEGEGIDLNSKSVTALRKIIRSLPNGDRAKMTVDNIKQRMRQEGVSEKEIKMVFSNTDSPEQYELASAIKEAYLKAHPEAKEDSIYSILRTAGLNPYILNRSKPGGKVPIRRALNLARDADIYTFTMEGTPYKRITKTFEGPQKDYVESGIYSKAVDSKGKYSHFMDEENFLGWMRESTDTLDGKPVHVLQEFQSDWAQGNQKASFPIDYSDFKKIAIVKGIDSAMRKGLDTMIIPIDREGSLHGSKAISKMYSELNKGILPKIRAQLDKAGLKIDTEVVKKEVGGYREAKEIVKSELRNIQDNLEQFDISRQDFVKMIQEMPKARSINELDEIVGRYSGELKWHLDPYMEDARAIEAEKAEKAIEDYFKITIHPKKGRNQIRWDMLGILSALGLADKYINEGEQ